MASFKGIPFRFIPSTHRQFRAQERRAFRRFFTRNGRLPGQLGASGCQLLRGAGGGGRIGGRLLTEKGTKKLRSLAASKECGSEPEGGSLKGNHKAYGFVFFWCVELLQKAEGGTSPNHTPESYPRIIPRIIPPNHTP